MTREPNPTLAELRRLVTAMETQLRTGDVAGLRTQVKGLKAWGRRLVQIWPQRGLSEENADLRQKLKASKSGFDATVSAYRALLDSFETYRGSIDQIQQIKRLEELPAALDAVRRLRNLDSLHLVLDEEFFSGRVPVGLHLVPGRLLRSHLRQFTPTPHAPRLYIGSIARIEEPGFFLGQDPPRDGSCFIFALRHKYLRGRIAGTMAAWDPDPERFAPDKATDFLAHFCDILANTLITALEHAQLEELSVRDTLTGLNNRVYLERHAGRMLDFAARKNMPVHLLFVDLNGFKAINDQLGHEAGDQILIAVGRAVQAMIRKYDIFVRLGGDEFVILLPDTTVGVVQTFVARLRRALDELNPREICGQDTDLRISASVGVARFMPPQTLDDLLHQADQRMYEDKAQRGQSEETR